MENSREKDKESIWLLMENSREKDKESIFPCLIIYDLKESDEN